MAVFHLSAQIIGRGTGRSAVAAAAYRSGGCLVDAGSGMAFDYTRKAGVIHAAVLLPAGAPDRLADRELLWNEVEAFERRKDAQLAREIELALPRELSDAVNIALVRAYVQDEFVARGMIADLSVHKPVGKDGEPRPHAHVLLSMRRVDESGFGPKERSWNGADLLHDWREGLAVRINQALAVHGFSARVDHRSYAERGIGLEPQSKIGAPGRRDRAGGLVQQRTAAHRALAARNGERLAADPGMALELLTEHSASFTRRDLARLVATHSDGAEQFTRVMARVLASPLLVRLGTDGRGEERFTSASMRAAEQRLREHAAGLGARRRHGVDEALGTRAVALAGLSPEQGRAVAHVTGAGGLALVVGYAGTGKSRMLGAAREAWEAAGYRVRGAALSGIAAEGLEAGSGIRSRTLASLEHAWGRERERLQRGDVLVIDEAGMVGTRQMERVLARAVAAGAKLVLVGDPEQLQSIAAGGWFRDLVARHGAATLSQVRRQRDAWQRAATVDLATGRTEAALLRYEAAGMIRAVASREEARAALVEAWSVDRRAAPARSRIMLAATRAGVRVLNDLARARLQEEGLLGRAAVIETARGSRSFAAGDRVLFLKNERSLGVKNGTLGTVERVEGQELQVRLDGPGSRRVSFHGRDYAEIEHGYATTIHKAQGTTVDYSYLLLTGHLDRHGSYVALSRHRQGLAAFYARDEFADLAALTRRLGRDGSKVMALPAELEAAGRGRIGRRLAELRAALGRVRAMVRGAGRWEAGEGRMATAQPDAGGTQRQRPAAASRLERQVALGREIAAQLRQQRAAEREMPARQDSATAGAASPGVAGSRLEQQAARGLKIAAELRQRRTAPRAAATPAPAQQAETARQTTRLGQQVAIARRVAARLRQRSRERAHGLEL